MKGILFTLFLVCSAITLHAQFEEGRLFSLALGTGVSDHAGSYTIQEDFRTKQFSGFRALIFEGRVGWNFWEMTNIFGVVRLSPSNSTISPYRSSYYGIGIDQAIPGQDRLYFTGNYGRYSSSLGRGRKAGSGNLFNIGVGLRIDDNLFIQGNITKGNLEGIDSSLNIDDKERQLFATVVYNF